MSVITINIITALGTAGVCLIGYFIVQAIRKAIKGYRENAEAIREKQDKAFILENYRGEAPFKVADGIEGMINNFRVQYVDVYGTRYLSIEDALANSTVIPEELKDGMKEMTEAMEEIREEIAKSKRHFRKEETEFDGDIYVYEPMRIKIDTEERKAKGLAARIGVKLDRQDDGTMNIDYIYVATENLSSASNRYEFDMTNESERESLKLLLFENKKYAEEVKEIERLYQRLEKYNNLVKEERIIINENGVIDIVPPSPEEIKRRRSEVAAPVLKPEVKKPEPKPQEDEFVSSNEAI